MKTIAKILGLVLMIISTTACMESGKIKVQNKVHNVKLENISWGDASVYYSLLPGETSTEKEIEDYAQSFPKFNPLEFYMVSGGNRVYLKTKQHYKLDYDQTLTIIISDTTELINPMIE